MKSIKHIASLLLLLGLTGGALCSCEDDSPTPEDGGVNPPEQPGNPSNPGTPQTPYSTIPDEMVGTWFAKDNKKPLTTYWEQGTTLGELGFRDFRTMVFTKDGKNAVEYSTFTVDVNGETRTRFYKITGTLEYKPNSSPRTLTFYAQSGVMRFYTTKASGYQESPIVATDMAAYRTVWQNPEATSFATGINYLKGQRLDGGVPVSAEYQKVDPNAPAPPSGPGTTPPSSGSYVKIGDLYYPTATIGSQEWTTLNYAGPGGIKDSDKPEYGTFIKAADLGSIPVPTGWRIPTRQDFVKLLASQQLALEPWGMTPDDVPTTRALGALMSTTNWRRVDGYATNATGFTAQPANIRVLDGNPHGEGLNCVLWTSERDDNNWPISFKIVQNTTTTYASIVPFAPGTVATTPHIPVRFVRDK